MLQDVEQGTLHRLADIRAAIAGEVQDADSVDAVRAALLRLFERFVVHIDLETRQGRIEAVVRPEAIRTVDEELRPILKPLPLGLTSNGKASCGGPRSGSG